VRVETFGEKLAIPAQPGSIILLHVMYSSRTESLKSVKKIIEGLRARAYTFKTVSELLATRGSVIQTY
jgi:peptidoglycan/xylan/chitin deacetylase (PgdA/CDA1 family)